MRSVRESANSVTSSFSNLRRCNTSLKADLFPIPGNIENCSTALFRSFEEYEFTMSISAIFDDKFNINSHSTQEI